MVARKLSSYDVATSPDSFSKRPSVYIDPDSDIFEGLQYLHNIKRQNCINCLHLWKKSSAALEGISVLMCKLRQIRGLFWITKLGD